MLDITTQVKNVKGAKCHWHHLHYSSYTETQVMFCIFAWKKDIFFYQLINRQLVALRQLNGLGQKIIHASEYLIISIEGPQFCIMTIRTVYSCSGEEYKPWFA